MSFITIRCHTSTHHFSHENIYFYLNYVLFSLTVSTFLRSTFLLPYTYLLFCKLRHFTLYLCIFLWATSVFNRLCLLFCELFPSLCLFQELRSFSFDLFCKLCPFPVNFVSLDTIYISDRNVHFPLTLLYELLVLILFHNSVKSASVFSDRWSFL